MTIQEAFCTGNARYLAAEPLSPQGVVLHSIGTPQPKASVLREYWQRNGSPYVVHYMVDDTQILHCMPDNRKCWHVGSPGNGRYLGVEMGEPAQLRYTSGATFSVTDLPAAQAYALAAYKNAAQLLASLCKAHGWDPDTAVYTHAELSKKHLSNTDHADPEHLWNGLGLGLSLLQLRRDVRAAMGSAGTAAPAAPAAEPYVVRVTASALNVRKGPGTTYGIAQVLPKGGAYTIVEEQNGWGLLKAFRDHRDGWIALRYTEKR